MLLPLLGIRRRGDHPVDLRQIGSIEQGLPGLHVAGIATHHQMLPTAPDVAIGDLPLLLELSGLIRESQHPLVRFGQLSTLELRLDPLLHRGQPRPGFEIGHHPCQPGVLGTGQL